MLLDTVAAKCMSVRVSGSQDLMAQYRRQDKNVVSGRKEKLKFES